MENKTYLMILFSTLLFSCFLIAQNSALMKQTEALWRFQKEKMVKFNTDIDKSPFDITDDHFHNGMKLEDPTGQKQLDLIVKLPGQPQVNFTQYGGYVTVNHTAGRALYYYFVEAQVPAEKPLVLWLNGGPGCSSLGVGAMTELGPFRVKSDRQTLYTNDYAWNQVANVLFLESPAGVGFSYSNTTSDSMSSGDRKTAADNYLFLVSWLERFPEYKNRDFYLCGESYAGHYVPQLAQTILHQNRKAKKTIINIKGLLLGNAWMNDEADTHGMFKYFESHALISVDTAYQIKENCDFSPKATKLSKKCIKALQEVDNDIDGIDIYNIYAPLCFNPNLTDKPKNTSLLDFDPCTLYYIAGYLNRLDVQKALHANITKIKGTWDVCSSVLKKWTDSPYTVLPLFQEFQANGLRVWIFSGDIDGRVPVTSTQLNIKQLKLDITKKWRPWTVSNEEVAGYTEEYDGNLTFVTVRAAGHEVPSYQPVRALKLITKFLAGERLTDSPGN